jgi:molybdate transport system regulatory protein
MSTLKIKGHIWIENSKGHLIGPGRKELLEAIRDNGSIKLAARAMKMSYRHAWEIINELNRISIKPIVIKNTGGKNGGGAVVTKEGENLIATYEKLNKEFENFKLQINKAI